MNKVVLLTLLFVSATFAIKYLEEKSRIDWVVDIQGTEIGPEGLAWSVHYQELWAVAHHAAKKEGILQRVNLDAEGHLLGMGLDSTINLNRTTLSHIPLDITDITFNGQNNFVLIGDRVDDAGRNRPVLWTLNYQGEQIIGPITLVAPMSTGVTGIAYDCNRDTYWVTEARANALYEAIVTCCEEKNRGQDLRWAQQLKVRRGCGLQYGLAGWTNVFAKRDQIASNEPDGLFVRSDEAAVEETRNDPFYGTSHHGEGHGPRRKHHHDDDDDHTRRPLPMIAIPGFDQPQGVSVDPETGNLWIVNSFPTTTLFEVTNDCVVCDWYNMEQSSASQTAGDVKDANSLAVTKDSIYVGFDTEEMIVQYCKPEKEFRECVGHAPVH